MPPQDICILGNSGSGKSYLAKALASSFSPPLSCIHLDHVYFDTSAPRASGRLLRRPEPEKQALCAAALAAAPPTGWVSEGVFGELVQHFLSAAPAPPTLLWLAMPWPLCESRLRTRRDNLGACGPDTAESTEQLAAWAAAYYTRTDPRSAAGHEEMLKAHAGAVALRSEAEVEVFLAACAEAGGDVRAVAAGWAAREA